MNEIMISTGTMDCHLEENARRAVANFCAGKPLSEGQIEPTVIDDPRFPLGYMVLDAESHR